LELTKHHSMKNNGKPVWRGAGHNPYEEYR